MTNIDQFIEQRLGELNLDGDTASTLKEVNKLKQRGMDIGIDEALLEPRESLFGKILNTIDKPKQVVQGVIDSAFIRQDIGEIGLLGAAERGLDERINAFDILRRETDLNPIARGVLGFAGEVLTDPLNLLTLGTTGAAKAGGRALTKAGVAKKGELVANLVNQGEDLFKADDLVKSTFEAIGDFEDARKTLATTDNMLAVGQAQHTLSRQRRAVQEGLEAMGLGPDLLEASDTLFKKPGIKLSTSLPFLGHVKDDFDIGAKAVGLEKVADDTNSFKSLLRSAYNVAGEVVKPGKIDIADIEFSDSLIESYNNAKALASEGAKRVEEFFDLAVKNTEGVPVVGSVTKVAHSVKEGTKEFKKVLGEAFSRKAVFGARGADYTTDFLTDKAVASHKALNDSREVFGGIGGKTYEEILSTAPEMVEKRRQAGQLIDSALEEGILKRFDSIRNPAEREALESGYMSYIREVSTNPDAPFRYADKFEGIEDDIIGNLKTVMSDTSIDPDVREFMSRTVKGFQDMRQRELELGIKSGLVEAYIPHRYTNLEKDIAKASGVGSSFKASRKYRTLKDAFENKGYLAETDVAQLFYARAKQSYIAQAKKRYSNRMLLLHGLPADKVRDMYNAAKFNPEGAEAQILAQYRLELPNIGSEQDTINALKQFSRSRDKDAAIFKNPKIKALANKTAGGVDNLIANYADITARMDEDLLSRTGILKDVDVPRLAFGEIASPMKADDGSTFYLPSDIAKGIEEVIQSKDVVREFFKGSKAGTAVVDALDSITNNFKKITTLPWPAYWSQNLFGDAWFRAADGGLHAVEPGSMGRVMGLLRGTHSVKLRNGTTIDPATFQRVLKEGGINFGYDEALDVMRHTADSDLTRQVKRAKGALKNLKVGKGSEFNPLIAMESASQGMRNTFENFFRANHVLHHIERGDSFADATRGATEAMINYRNLTEIERSVFRRFYMFYGWIGGSTKKAITQLFTNPGALQQQLKGAQSLAEFFSDPDAAPSPEEFDMKTLRSLVSEEQVAFALGKGKDGKPIIGRGFGLPLNTALQQFSVQLPRNMQVGELIGTFTDSVSRTAQKQFASANPVLKGAAELVTGRNLYFDKPLDTRFLRRLPELQEAAKKLGVYEWSKVPVDAVDSITKEFLGGVPDGKGNLVVDPGMMWVLVNVIPGMGRAISTARTFSDTELDAKHGALRALTGVRVEDSDPTRSRLYDEKRELQDLLRGKDVDLREAQQKRELFGL